MRRRLLTAVLSLLVALSVPLAIPTAQAVDVPVPAGVSDGRLDSRGTEFWIAFPSNYPGYAVPSLSLHISAEQATKATVEIPGTNFVKTVDLVPGAPSSVSLGSSAQILAADGVERKGIHVTAERDVTVYALNMYNYTTDAYLALPIDAVGTSYSVMSYRNNPVVSGTEFAVTPTRDNTTVTIVPAYKVGSRVAGVPYTVVLNRGDVYQLRNDERIAAADLTGSRVTSDKPVSVFGGSACAFVPGDVWACDHLVEQLFPTSTWGKEYVTVPLAGRKKGDTFGILAAESPARVLLNGKLLVELPAWGKWSGIIEGYTHIESDAPISVAQFANGSQYDGAQSDPMMLMVPPKEQYLKSYTVTTLGSFTSNYIDISAPTNSLAGIRIDGAPVDPAKFHVIGNSGYSGAQILLKAGAHTLTGTAPFGVAVYGWSDYESYGYPGGLSFGRVAQIAALSLTARFVGESPTGERRCFDATVTDDEAKPLSDIQVEFTVAGPNKRTETITTNAHGIASLCYTGTASGEDAITATTDELSDDVAQLWFSNRAPVAHAGGPYEVDEGGTVLLDGTASTDADADELSFEWNLNADAAVESTASKPIFDASALDGPSTHTASVEVCDPSGKCDSSSAEIRVKNVAPSVDAGRDQTVFRNEVVTLDGSWSDPAKAKDAPYAWKWAAQSNDNTTGNATEMRASTTRTFGAAGSYDASLDVADNDGGAAADAIKVRVLNRPPSCVGLNTTLGTIWSPNHQMVDVPLGGATDPEGDALSVRVISVTQDERLNARGDGSTAPDAEGIGTGSVRVLSERSGTGDGRVYVIGVRATDASGASCVGSVTVTVAHDKNTPAVDSKVRYSSITGASVDPSATIPSDNVPASLDSNVTTVTGTTEEDTALDVQLVASNIGTTDVSFAALGSGPAHGTFTSGSATCETVGAGSRCTATGTYRPSRDFAGTDEFRVVAISGSTGWTGTASIVVTPVNDAPELSATPKPLVVTEDSGRTDVSVVATDIETDPAAITVTVTEVPAHGTLRNGDATVAAGDVLAGGLQELTFEPAANYVGADSFAVKASDDATPSKTAAMSIPVTVTALDDAPVAAEILSDTDEDSAVTLTLVATDVDSRSLTFDRGVAVIPGSAGVIGEATCADVAAGTRCTATVRYTPAVNASGVVEFALRVRDARNTSPVPVRLTISPINDAPTLTATSTAVTVAEDTTSSAIRFQTGDVETAPADLRLKLTAAPANGVIKLGAQALAAGEAVPGPIADLTYTPAADYAGPDTFTITSVDTGDGSAPAQTQSLTIPVTVTAVNDNPTAPTVTVAGREDQPSTVTLVATDRDNNTLTFTKAVNPSKATWGAISTPSCSRANGLTTCTATVIYTPAANENGADTFGVNVADGLSTVRLTTNVTITAVNDTPTAASDALEAVQNKPLVFAASALLSNDTRGPANESSQSLTVTEVNAVESTHGTVALASGQVTYTPAPGYTGAASFRYTACDNGTTDGAADHKCATGTVTVTVIRSNAKPVVTTTPVTTVEDTSATVTFTAVDADGDDITFTNVTATNGILGPLTVVACVTVEAGKQCTTTATYTPASNYAGAATVTFSAGDGITTTAGSIAVTVTAVNDNPTLTGAPSPFLVTEDATATLTVTGSDPETAAANLVVKLDVLPVNGTLKRNGTTLTAGATFTGAATALVFTPNANYFGADTIRVTITDADGGTATVDLPVQVSSVNDNPTAGIFTTTARAGVPLEVPTADITAEGTAGPENEADQPLRITAIATNASTHGTATLANGVITYTPTEGYEGPASFTYTLCDTATSEPVSACVQGTATFDVIVAGPAPTIGSITPVDGARITAPTQVKSAITAPVDGAIGLWKVTVTPVDGGALTVVAEGTGTPPAVLGVLDPSVLANGPYTLTVSAETTDAGLAEQSVTVLVDGELKLGRLALDFDDVNAALGSTVLPLTRHYDSLEKRSGDFGYGWTLSADGFKVSTNRVLGAEDWERYNTSCQFVICQEAYRASNSRFVAVRFPDGHVEAFDFTPKAVQFSDFATVAFTARRGTTSTLAVVGDDQLVDTADGVLRDMDTMDAWAPTQFLLTTRTGQKLTLSIADGLKSLREPTGVTYTVSNAGIISTAGGGAVFTRDARGRITRVDAEGTVRYSYNSAGDLATVTDGAGRVTTYSYDANHRLTGITGENNTPLRRMEYDASGRLVALIDGAGNRTPISSDPAAKAETVTDPTGRMVTTSVYDDLGNVVTKTETADGVSRTWRYTYDADGNVLTATDPLGRVITSTYNTSGDLLTSVDAASRATSFTYFANGQLRKRTDPGNVVTEYTYDANFQMKTKKDAAGSTETYTYDAAGRVTAVTDVRGKTTSYTYDAAGRLTAKVDPLNRATRYTYDANGNVASSTDGAGNVTSMTYDAAGKLTKRTDPLGAVTTFTYDSAGLLASETAPGGSTTTFTYAANGLLSSKTDGAGNTTAFTYDAARRLTSTTDGAGGVATNSYDGFGQVTQTTDPAGRVTKRTYDLAGQQLTQVAPDGGTTTFAYDALGRRTSVTDPLGKNTQGSYDAAGRVSSVTDRMARTTTFAYDALGRRTSVTDPLGAVSRTEYDAAGNITATVDATGGRTTYTYDDAGQLLTQTDATSRTMTYTYDNAGRLTKQTDAAGNVTKVEYDSAGRITAAVTASETRTTFTYDARGNRTAVTDALGHTSSAEYDAANRLVKTIDALGNATSYTVDGAGRRTAMTDALGGVVRLEYNAAGDTTKVTDPAGVVVTYGYDAAGRRNAQTDGLGKKQQWAYDSAGRMTSWTNARGQATNYTYDAVGALTGTTGPDGPTTHTYDNAGRRTAMSDATGTTSFTNDAAGRVTAATSPAGSLSIGYDGAGRRTQLTINNAATTYTHNAAGRVANQVDATGTTTFGYTPDGLLAAINRPNGVNTAFTFDTAARLTAVRHNGAGTTAHFDYTLDAAGNRTALTGPAGTETFTYDALHRLTSSAGVGDAVNYTYDAAGNRTKVETGGSSTAYTYNAAGQLKTVGGANVTVDADGNITALDGETFTYNAANQLTGITAAGASTEFVYDADGNRTKTSGASSGTALFDPMATVPTALSTNGAVIGRDPNANPVAITTSTGTAFPLVDALGSVRANTDTTGTVTATTDYDAYGQTRTSTGTTGPVGYTGALTDPAGLVNLNARTYNPGIGQLLQTDTYEIGGPGTTGYNRHTYANNNPLRYTDPTGHTTLGEQSGAMSVQNTLMNIGQQSAQQLLRHFARQLAKMMGKIVRNRVTSCAKQALLEAPAEIAMTAALGAITGGASTVTAPSVLVDVSGNTISCIATGGAAKGPGSNLVPGPNGAMRDPATGLFAPNPNRVTAAPSQGAVHGNSLDSPRTTYLYQLYDNNDQYLKTGITDDPGGRYSQKFMEDKYMDIINSGNRRNMVTLERHIVEIDPGPLNREPWAGGGL